jgi:hypothetical protein
VRSLAFDPGWMIAHWKIFSHTKSPCWSLDSLFTGRYYAMVISAVTCFSQISEAVNRLDDANSPSVLQQFRRVLHDLAKCVSPWRFPVAPALFGVIGVVWWGRPFCYGSCHGSWFFLASKTMDFAIKIWDSVSLSHKLSTAWGFVWQSPLADA